MKKGDLIGIGMTAEVYEWGPDKVLKLYFKRFPGDWAYREAGVGKAVYEAGAPSPNVYDVVDLNGRKGVVFQRIHGRSVVEHIMTEPYALFSYTQKVAQLHYRIHSCSSENKKMPSQMERFEYALGRSSKILGDRRERILDYMKQLPDGNTICHGDLHYNNVIISDHRLVAIDWSASYRGSPLGDVARTCLIMLSPCVPNGFPGFLTMMSGFVKEQICRTYLEEYMRLSKVRLRDVEEWILPVAAAKLKDNVPGDEKWLMDIIDKRLNQYEKSKLPGVN